MSEPERMMATFAAFDDPDLDEALATILDVDAVPAAVGPDRAPLPFRLPKLDPRAMLRDLRLSRSASVGVAVALGLAIAGSAMVIRWNAAPDLTTPPRVATLDVPPVARAVSTRTSEPMRPANDPTDGQRAALRAPIEPAAGSLPRPMGDATDGTRPGLAPALPAAVAPSRQPSQPASAAVGGRPTSAPGAQPRPPEGEVQVVARPPTIVVPLALMQPGAAAQTEGLGRPAAAETPSAAARRESLDAIRSLRRQWGAR